MRKIKELLQWMLFMLYLPAPDDETDEEWAVLNGHPDLLTRKAQPFQFCGTVGIELAFRKFAAPNPANLVLLHGVHLIVDRNPATGTLIATRISEWFQVRATAATPPAEDDKSLVRELVKLFCTLKLSVDPEIRVSTWFRIIHLYPKIAEENELPQEIGRITRGDSTWLPEIYTTIRRPEPEAEAKGDPPEAESIPTTAPEVSPNRVQVETLFSSILCCIVLADLSVPDLTRLAFRHPNPGVRINAITVLSGLHEPLNREVVNAGLTQDHDLVVRLHCAKLREGMGLSFSNCVAPLLKLMFSERREDMERVQRFILDHDIEAIPGLVAALDPESPTCSVLAVTLLYNILKNSPKRKHRSQELIAAFTPYVGALSSILPHPWISGWVAARLAYMIGVVDKTYLSPPPPATVA
jgi:hypothetical protein